MPCPYGGAEGLRSWQAGAQPFEPAATNSTATARAIQKQRAGETPALRRQLRFQRFPPEDRRYKFNGERCSIRDDLVANVVVGVIGANFSCEFCVGENCVGYGEGHAD